MTDNPQGSTPDPQDNPNTDMNGGASQPAPEQQEADQTQPEQPIAPQPQPAAAQQPSAAFGPAASASPTAAPPRPPKKRSNTVGLVAALVVGALVGGVSGAGVTALALNANQGDQVSANAAINPANITVNDRDNATLITKVAAQATPSVVTISVKGTSSAGTGSGIILSKDGYVLTNTHVVTLDGEVAKAAVKVQTYDGHLYSAKVIGTDPISDLAVIKIESDAQFQPLEFADSSKLNVGDSAIAIGAPLALSNTVTNGIVSALNRSISIASSAAPKSTDPNDDDDNGNNGNGPFDFWQFGGPDEQQQQNTQKTSIAIPVIQTDAAINPGNSGGALLNIDGKVMGVNVAIASAGATGGSQSGSIGVGFAIPANLAKRVAGEIIKNGKATHGLLGALVADISDDPATADSSVVGATIEGVTRGGAADKAGLRKGDIVTRFNGVPIGGKTDITAQVRVLAGGAKTQLTYVRGGTSHTVDVELGTLK